MLVREVLALLSQCDQDRMVYVSDHEGKAQPLAVIIDLRHCNLGEDLKGLKLTDDIALLPSNLAELLIQEDDE